MDSNKPLVNRCDMCGQFKQWNDLREYESCHLSMLGEVMQNWWFECTECRPDPPISLPGMGQNSLRSTQ